MSVVIRLMRVGAKKRPFYRMVAADSRRQRDGRFLEILGHYNPIANPHQLTLEKERIEKWLAQGAQPSDQAASLLRSQGMRWGKASTSNKPKVDASAPKAAKKKSTKKAMPRKLSTRKVEKKAARKSTKKAAKAKAQQT